ncbi:MAG: bifunctional phosphoribosyl-AMP cyclohydrolase/phosphoribosyl-ATP diphosphatase HisIE [Nitrospiria bacterium]
MNGSLIDCKNMDLDFSKIKFSNGLIPAVIQDAFNKDVLMVAYMNRESLRLSLETGETHFWSRSRKKLWKKGETSGHVQKIKKIFVDCDEDTLLIEVEQIGAACHTGKRSCFFRTLTPEGQIAPRTDSGGKPGAQNSVLELLSETILARKQASPAKSYTSLLLEGGIDRILKKVAEEAGEFIIGAKNGERGEIIHETADLLYHMLVTLGFYGISFKEIEQELQKRTARSGLAEKAGRTLKKSPSAASAKEDRP